MSFSFHTILILTVIPSCLSQSLPGLGPLYRLLGMKEAHLKWKTEASRARPLYPVLLHSLAPLGQYHPGGNKGWGKGLDVAGFMPFQVALSFRCLVLGLGHPRVR